MSQKMNNIRPATKIKRLLQYCGEKNITISPALQTKHSPASGYGLYATKKIRKGQRVIHAPTSCLITTATIPSTFVPNPELREDLTVHGLLAAWLAFGDQNDIEDRFGPWIDVWPSWECFREGMPVFWNLDGYDLRPVIINDKCEDQVDIATSGRKRRKTSGGGHMDGDSPRNAPRNGLSRLKPTFNLSPAITGTYLSTKQLPESKKITSPALLTIQVKKITHILQLLHQHASVLGFDILDMASHSELRRFLHMWSCVNTRCFYYLPLNTPAPSDPNEAMALVPFQDLFNHSTIEAGCKTKFDKNGFSVYANKDYNEGDELYLLYGHHSEDALWTEYGFMHESPSKNLALPNKDDSLPLDPLILPNLSSKHKTLLAEREYLGSYTLTQSGICYRTEITAWLVSNTITQSEWEGMIDGTFDLETQNPSKYQESKQKVMKTIITWLSQIKTECHQNLTTLLSLQQLDTKQEDEILKTFLPDTTLLHPDEITSSNNQKLLQLAKGRMNMCINKWKGIYELYSRAIRAIEDDYSSESFIVNDNDNNAEAEAEEGRSKEVLMIVEVNEFVECIVEELEERKKKGKGEKKGEEKRRDG